VNRRLLLVLFAILFFLLGAAAKLYAPLSYWDQATLDWASSGGLVPIRTSLLSLLGWRGLGIVGLASPQILRSVQVLGVLLAVPFVMLLARRVWAQGGPGAVAAALYLLSPATIQGIQSVDTVDSSYLPAIFAAWAVCYLSADRWGWRGWLVLAAVSAAAFGLKSTSSLGLFFVPAFGILLAGSGSERRSQVLKLVAVTCGLLVFSLVWAVVPLDLRLEAAAGEVSSGLRTIVSPDLARVAFLGAIGLAWWSPFMMAMIGIGAMRLWHRGDYQSRALLCGTATYAAAYLALGGMNHGYPRYHMAVLPIFCAIAAGATSLAGLRSRGWLVAAAAAVLLAMIVGDPIFGLNLEVREALVEGTLRSRLAAESLRWAAWIAIPLVVLTAGLRARGPLLPVATFASFLALGLIQFRADYNTGYEYGGSGHAEVVERVRQEVAAGAAVIAPPSLTMRLRADGFHGMAHPDWYSRASVREYIGRASPQALLLGMTENSIDQLNWLLNDPPEPFAACVGNFERVGSHWLCFPATADSTPR